MQAMVDKTLLRECGTRNSVDARYGLAFCLAALGLDWRERFRLRPEVAALWGDGRGHSVSMGLLNLFLGFAFYWVKVPGSGECGFPRVRVR